MSPAWQTDHEGAIAIFVFSGVGISRMVVDSNWLDDFSYDMPIKAITERVDSVMGGTTNVIYLFDSGESDGIKEPEVLREIERVQEIANEHGWLVRKTYSIVDILKDLNQSFHADDPWLSASSTSPRIRSTTVDGMKIR